MVSHTRAKLECARGADRCDSFLSCSAKEIALNILARKDGPAVTFNGELAP